MFAYTAEEVVSYFGLKSPTTQLVMHFVYTAFVVVYLLTGLLREWGGGDIFTNAVPDVSTNGYVWMNMATAIMLMVYHLMSVVAHATKSPDISTDHGQSPVEFNEIARSVEFKTPSFVALSVVPLTLGWFMTVYQTFSNWTIVAGIMFVVCVFGSWTHTSRFWPSFNMGILAWCTMCSFGVWGMLSSPIVANAYTANSRWTIWTLITLSVPNGFMSIQDDQAKIARYFFASVAFGSTCLGMTNELELWYRGAKRYANGVVKRRRAKVSALGGEEDGKP